MADMDPQGIPSPEPDNKPAAGNDSQPTPRWIPPQRIFEQRLADVQRARNPILEASGRLVRCLCDLPERLAPAETERLRELINEELDTFKALVERANVKREHVIASHYAICTALDDVVLQQEWGQGWWASHSLLVQHHQDNLGGEKVYQVLGRLVESPHEHIAVIELIYYLMSLGFMGRYRTMTDGDRQHHTIRQRLYDLLLKHYGPVPQELSPHIEAAPPGRFPRLYSVSPWMTAAVLAVVLLGMFAWMKRELLLRQHDLLQQIEAIGRMTPPPWPQALHLAEWLKDEIARGVVTVHDNDRGATVVFRGDDIFRAGQADVNKRLLPTLNKVASEINKVQGKVQVIGHSDNQPIKSVRFPSNQVLSEERAAVVSAYLASQGVAKGRLEAIGKGDSEPVGDNKTIAGRAANRRVEVVVTQ
ncbi:type VI secretion system protein TssL, long form [Cupriavidus basilensis]|uniref:Outer membrane protein ImpK/VasF, OmpA/MotB domain n=1 Tax=Cupriavidus basilensis TaxID=68895 RepID=A0A0C4YFG3_9BURK|nr:type VI secretion system protein TssL, long form [Cupriavidus basilensis]AJG20689.1 Outer membrane protein ImpK/VasF, OmpA/MotB domain [Cupriavidus basilensis]